MEAVFYAKRPNPKSSLQATHQVMDWNTCFGCPVTQERKHASHQVMDRKFAGTSKVFLYKMNRSGSRDDLQVCGIWKGGWDRINCVEKEVKTGYIASNKNWSNSITLRVYWTNWEIWQFDLQVLPKPYLFQRGCRRFVPGDIFEGIWAIAETQRCRQPAELSLFCFIVHMERLETEVCPAEKAGTRGTAGWKYRKPYWYGRSSYDTGRKPHGPGSGESLAG